MEENSGRLTCEVAIRSAPKSILPRMEFQYARSRERARYGDGYGLINVYEKAAAHHYMAAYTALGWLYYSGKWVDQDFQKAFEWYEKGAKAGDPTAMNNISIMYVKGIGVAKDKAKANYWYQKALDSGISRTDSLSRDAPESIKSFATSYQEYTLDKAYSEAKGFALEGLRKCSEGGEKEGILDESSVTYDEPSCDKITNNFGSLSYQCSDYAYGTCMHALLREGDIEMEGTGRPEDTGAILFIEEWLKEYPEENSTYKNYIKNIGKENVYAAARKVVDAPKNKMVT